MPEEKIYLGDGLYAKVEHGDIIVTSENGVCVLATLCFDYNMVKKLNAFTEAHTEMNRSTKCCVSRCDIPGL